MLISRGFGTDKGNKPMQEFDYPGAISQVYHTYAIAYKNSKDGHYTFQQEVYQQQQQLYIRIKNCKHGITEQPINGWICSICVPGALKITIA
jgi:hypothetical protein